MLTHDAALHEAGSTGRPSGPCKNLRERHTATVGTEEMKLRNSAGEMMTEKRLQSNFMKELMQPISNDHQLRGVKRKMK